MKRPITTPIKSTEDILRDTIKGTASIANLRKMENNASMLAFDWDCAIFMGINCPIIMKLRILKNVPTINPLPKDFSPKRIEIKAITIAHIIA